MDKIYIKDYRLHKAVKANNLDEIHQLLAESDCISDDIGQKDRYGHNALHYAVLHEDGNVLELLLNTNLDKEIINAGDEYETTPLHFAVREGCLHNIGLLLKHGANIDARDCKNQTALHLASKDNNLFAAKYLLDNGADKVPRDCKEDIPMYLAVKNGSKETAKLLWDYKASSWAVYDMIINDNPLMDFLELFLENSNEHNRAHFLHAAIKQDKLDAVKLICQKSSPPIKGLYDDPLFDAIKQSRYDIVKFFIENEINIYNKDQNRDTALHLAAEQDTKLVSWFLQPDLINAKGCNGQTPLHVALKKRHFSHEVIKLLLENDADACAVDNFHSAPIHCFIRSISNEDYSKNGIKKIIKHLVLHGADINAKDLGGKTPLDLTIYSPYWKGTINTSASILSTGLVNLTEQIVELDKQKIGALLLAEDGILAGAYILAIVRENYDCKYIEYLSSKLSEKAQKLINDLKQKVIPGRIDYRLFDELDDCLWFIQRANLISKKIKIDNPLSPLLPHVEKYKCMLTDKVAYSISSNFVALPESKLSKICNGIFLQDLLNYFASHKDSTASINKGLKDVLCELFSYFGPKDLEEFYKISQGSMYKEEDVEHEAKRVKLETEGLKVSGDLLTDQLV
ncbi:hypothetical protein phytr_11300 [Candidatus Phycorickettsia trachydisci]|uniref:Uncharacterized protein n=1 Tax=Candidatus Phycorickettsia trachydisci TaxID=2115978 RepID=A0A2P1P9Y0_9RICK|nr:ankyrin repeat domain-containing protein [Candidatus Phycorickettsia trachydisci]AVP88055.1 hypothetical protein phytr_11300 [Candidatus Phycorickettsia trachydisci]